MRAGRILHRGLEIAAMTLVFLMAAGLAAPSGRAQTGAIDDLVAACLDMQGVSLIPETATICYNAPIFPEEFLKLHTTPAAEQIIITSPGGNVATARVMSGILATRTERAIIAGPCMSACAMIILPGLKEVEIHDSAHIAVHGIAMMPFATWWSWLRDDEEPGAMAMMLAQTGYDFKFSLHASGRRHIVDHLDAHGVDIGYIQSISDAMAAVAAMQPCRVDPGDYWGMLDAKHLAEWLGPRVQTMGRFAQTLDDPSNRYFREDVTAIGPRTYIFNNDFAEAKCVD